MAQHSSTSAPLHCELNRILSSKGPADMVNQIRSYSSIDCQIEKELAIKSKQISELQMYFKHEIANLQGIMDTNSELKKQLEVAKVDAETQSAARQELEGQLRSLTEINRQSHSIISRLEERTAELEQEAQNREPRPDNNSQGVQTQSNQVQCSASRMSQQTANSLLLDKISSLEELVMQLKFQNSQLRIERGLSEGPSQSQISQVSEPQQTNVLTTDCVLTIISEDALREAKFRGQLLDGKKEGRGLCEYQQGIAYRGDFRQGLRHGLGVLTVDGETVYRGYWKNGVMEGKGQLFVLEGEIESYEGHFKEGRLEGIGCMRLKSGKRVTAQWSQGRMTGPCLEQMEGRKCFRPVQLIECY